MSLLNYYSVATKFSQFFRRAKKELFLEIIIKQTYCQNLRVESAIVLVLFKLLYFSNTDKFMNDIIFCPTKYVVIMNVIKKLKKLIYTNDCMGNCKIFKIGDTWIESDFRFICGYFFVTGNHNKTENEILSIRSL
jgi:hypothetical protein